MSGGTAGKAVDGNGFAFSRFFLAFWARYFAQFCSFSLTFAHVLGLQFATAIHGKYGTLQMVLDNPDLMEMVVPMVSRLEIECFFTAISD
jgi:hypothetical protein